MHEAEEREGGSRQRKGGRLDEFAFDNEIPSCYCLAQRSGASALTGVKQFRAWLATEIDLHKRAMNLKP